MKTMTEAQWRAWLKNKCEAFAYRIHLTSGKRYRNKPQWLLDNLEAIAREAEERRPKNV